jgi:DNA invertase Pin-like site-specific DNA recombinase
MRVLRLTFPTMNHHDISPDPDLAAERDDAFGQLLDAIRRGVVLLIRQSSSVQRGNRGSQLYQRNQIGFLAAYGVRPEEVHSIIATGDDSESASSAGPHFRELLARIQAGKCGLVVIAHDDRLARNDHVSALLDALAAVDGLLMVGGQVFDPGDAAQRLFLDLQATLAKFENRQRAMRIVASKMSLAREFKCRIALPTGLVWADPGDPVYLKHLRAAGLEHVLDDLPTHREEWINKQGTRRLILPFPDRQVFESIRLRLQYLREERSVPGVIRRIHEDPSWPVPGHIPVMRKSVFDPEARLTAGPDDVAGAQLRWVPLHSATVGFLPGLDRSRLHTWFKSPALYGTYRMSSKALLASKRAAKLLGAVVDVPAVFPSLFASEDWHEVRTILKQAPQPWKRSARYLGSRVHLLDHIVCTHPMRGGVICGQSLRMTYSTATPNSRTYKSSICQGRGHANQLPVEVEDLVLQVTLEYFQPETLADALSMLEHAGAGEAHRVRTLEREIADRASDIEIAADKSLEARKNGDREEESYWDSRRRAAREEKEKKGRELAQVKAATDTTRRLTDAERSAVVALASDLPTLFAQARAFDGMGRELMSALVKRVCKCVDLVEVEFPTGHTESRLFFTEHVRSSSGERAYAWRALRRWMDLDVRQRETGKADAAARAVANALNRLVPVTTRHAPWDAERAWALALAHEFHDRVSLSADFDDPSRGEPMGTLRLSVRELAKLAGWSRLTTLRTLLRGRLGEVSVVGDTLQTTVSLAQLHRQVPTIAERAVRAEQGWDDGRPVQRLIDLMADLGLKRYRLLGAADRGAAGGRGAATDAAGVWWVDRNALDRGLEMGPR